MEKRGRVLRDTGVGPGLLMVEGRQYPFALEGVWKSETAPKSGLVVDVELDSGGQIAGITAVPESRLAKEQAEATMAAAKEKGSALVSGLVTRFGLPTLVAEGLLLVGWFFLAAMSLDNSIVGQMQFTFWQVLAFLNSRNIFETFGGGGTTPAAGAYGLLAIACLAGPFLGYFLKDKRAHLGAALPLAFMIVIAFMARSGLQNASGWSSHTQSDFAEMQQRAQDETMKAISLGLGAYASLLASSCLAGIGARKFLIEKASEAQIYVSSQKSAA